MLKSNYFFQKDRDKSSPTISLETIGQKLKAAREAQGLNLIQVYERTKIPVNHLQSIDSGSAGDLPEPVYVCGFIKRYADAVGLDGQILSDEYRHCLEGQDNRASIPAAFPEYISKPKVKVSTPTIKTAPFNILIITFTIATACWLLNSLYQNKQNQLDPSLLSLKESTAKLTPVNNPTPQPALTPVQPTTEHIKLSAIKHVWVEIKRLSNGESIYTGYLEQGDSRDFEDSQGLIVRAGDGGSLSVEKAGKTESFGASGKVVERTFTLPVSTASPAATAPGEKAPAVPASPTTPKKVKRSAPASTNRYRSIEGSRQYVPGESLGSGQGTRSIDVPYRYTEGD